MFETHGTLRKTVRFSGSCLHLLCTLHVYTYICMEDAFIGSLSCVDSAPGDIDGLMVVTLVLLIHGAVACMRLYGHMVLGQNPTGVDMPRYVR